MWPSLRAALPLKPSVAYLVSRSGAGISAIFAGTALSSLAFPPRERRAAPLTPAPAPAWLRVPRP